MEHLLCARFSFKMHPLLRKAASWSRGWEGGLNIPKVKKPCVGLRNRWGGGAGRGSREGLVHFPDWVACSGLSHSVQWHREAREFAPGHTATGIQIQVLGFQFLAVPSDSKHVPRALGEAHVADSMGVDPMGLCLLTLLLNAFWDLGPAPSWMPVSIPPAERGKGTCSYSGCLYRA